MMDLKFTKLDTLVVPLDLVKVPEIIVNSEPDEDGYYKAVIMHLGLEGVARSKERAVGFLLEAYARKLINETRK